MGRFTERIFDVAYVLRVSPREVMALNYSEFLIWETQATRIAELQTKQISDG